jgi:hypothetical protein
MINGNFSCLSFFSLREVCFAERNVDGFTYFKRVGNLQLIVSRRLPTRLK